MPVTEDPKDVMDRALVALRALKVPQYQAGKLAEVEDALRELGYRARDHRWQPTLNA